MLNAARMAHFFICIALIPPMVFQYVVPLHQTTRASPTNPQKPTDKLVVSYRETDSFLPTNSAS